MREAGKLIAKGIQGVKLAQLALPSGAGTIVISPLHQARHDLVSASTNQNPTATN